MVSVPPVVAPSPSPARFTLPAAAWIAWGLYAAVKLVGFLMAEGEASPYAWGNLFGNLVGALIAPALVAWLGWRVSRRSSAVRTVAFFVALVAILTGQLSRAVRESGTSAAMDQLKEEQRQLAAEQRAALDAGQPLDHARATQVAERAADQLRVAAENASGSERLIIEAGQAFTNELLAANRRYSAAMTAADMETFFQIEKLSNPGEIARRRKAVQEFAAANAEMTTLQASGAERLRAELEKRGLAEGVIRTTLRSYAQTTDARRPFMLKIRETDAQLAETMLGFLELAEGKLGTWKIEEGTGRVLFEEDAAVKRYNELMQRVDALALEQAEYQRKVTELGR